MWFCLGNILSPVLAMARGGKVTTCPADSTERTLSLPPAASQSLIREQVSEASLETRWFGPRDFRAGPPCTGNQCGTCHPISAFGGLQKLWQEGSAKPLAQALSDLSKLLGATDGFQALALVQGHPVIPEVGGPPYILGDTNSNWILSSFFQGMQPLSTIKGSGPRHKASKPCGDGLCREQATMPSCLQKSPEGPPTSETPMCVSPVCS